MFGESLALGGCMVPGFVRDGWEPGRTRILGVMGPNDPDIFSTLTPAQQSWVAQTLSTLHAKILANTPSTCPTWAEPTTSAYQAAVGCFQAWANGLSVPLNAVGKLRSDGAMDQDTLTALQSAVAQYPQDFPTPFPAGPANQPTPAPTSPPVSTPSIPTQSTPVKEAPAAHHGLSTGAMVGIGVAGVVVVGGGIYLATRGGGKKRRRR